MSHKSSDGPAGANRAPQRREMLKALAGLGIGTAVFHRALAAQLENSAAVTAEMIKQAEWISGLKLSDEERAATAGAMERLQQRFDQLRSVEVDYGIPPALSFHANAPGSLDRWHTHRNVYAREDAAPRIPDSEEDLAFLPVTELAALLRSRQITSVDLTQLYLNRLRRYDQVLRCVVTLTEELALRQAQRADREIRAGHYRGPLHGVPWGAKDLIAYPGYKTTWGAPQFKGQMRHAKATVAQRLDDAGAVLVAKLSLGALAWGDRWFGGMTRNPWDPEQGSSGSSAGSAAATAAGLVGFALGSETLGSIVSPCRRCGATGLRPTFGRVSRFGCMPLAWSMDKIGPIARSVEDCALILGAIHGHDGLDLTAVSQPFQWPPNVDLRTLKVGYFDNNEPVQDRSELQTLQELGVQLVPIRLPDRYPVDALTLILNTEAATVFDELTRQGNTQGLNRWPNAFRQGQFTPAVEYLRANRIRTLLMREMEQLFDRVDLYVDGDDLAITNLTGHPSVVLPHGFRQRSETIVPTAITFTGRLFGESSLLALADAYQRARAAHLRRPDMARLEGPHPQNHDGRDP